MIWGTVCWYRITNYEKCTVNAHYHHIITWPTEWMTVLACALCKSGLVSFSLSRVATVVSSTVPWCFLYLTTVLSNLWTDYCVPNYIITRAWLGGISVFPCCYYTVYVHFSRSCSTSYYDIVLVCVTLALKSILRFPRFAMCIYKLAMILLRTINDNFFHLVYCPAIID